MKPKPHNDTDPMPLDNKHSQDIDMKKQDTWLYVIGAVALIFIVLVLSMYFIHFARLSTDTTVWGTFGDYVGGSLNPLLSFLALIALLYTIRLQKRQLELSADELKASREELELTRKELKKTADAADRQATHFEAEAKRTDLYRIIEKLAKRIEYNYREAECITAWYNYGIKISIEEVMNHPSNETYYDRVLYISNQYEISNFVENILSKIVTDLRCLAAYLIQYHETQQFIVTPMPLFYKNEFNQLIIILRTGTFEGLDITGLEFFNINRDQVENTMKL